MIELLNLSEACKTLHRLQKGTGTTSLANSKICCRLCQPDRNPKIALPRHSPRAHLVSLCVSESHAAGAHFPASTKSFASSLCA